MRQTETLKYKKDFDRLFRRGKSAGSKYLVQIYMSNGLDHNRYAYIASKKTGNSVKRNRARRLIRESLRQYQEKISQGYDVLFIARKEIDGVKCQDVARSMGQTLKRSGLMR